jgi:hypothetical protein
MHDSAKRRDFDSLVSPDPQTPTADLAAIRTGCMSGPERTPWASRSDAGHQCVKLTRIPFVYLSWCIAAAHL